MSLLGHKIAESLSKSPDLASWGRPLTIKADIQLAAVQGNTGRLFKIHELFLN